MPSNTEKFDLYMKDPSTDGNDTFDIETMMNENWKKIDQNAFREQFGIKSLNYDSTNDRIEVSVGPGIAELFDSNEDNLLVKNDLETTYYIDAPVINTTYYFFIQDDSTFSHNTTGDIPNTAILLWEIATGSDLTTLTALDKRALLSSSGVILAKHLSNSDNPHNVTSQQINEITQVDATVSGTEYPVGLTYFSVSTATGYPDTAGTVFNVKYGDNRFTQYFYHHGSDGNTGVWVRHFYADTWTAFDKLETTEGSQAKVDTHANKTNNPHSVTAQQAGAIEKIREKFYSTALGWKRVAQKLDSAGRGTFLLTVQFTGGSTAPKSSVFLVSRVWTSDVQIHTLHHGSNGYFNSIRLTETSGNSDAYIEINMTEDVGNNIEINIMNIGYGGWELATNPGTELPAGSGTVIQEYPLEPNRMMRNGFEVWDSGVVEYGSNSNGEYVRYPNGVQVCWAVGKVDLTSSSPTSFTYPASFIETPAASWGVLGGVTTGDFSALWNAYVQSMTAWQFRTDGTGSTPDQNIAFKAIGRWK